MKKSEELKRDINKLESEYRQAVIDESKILIWTDSKASWNESDMVGFHNMTKGRKLLEALYDGKTLYLEHEGVGNHLVYMNPQRNRYIIYKVHRRDGLIEVLGKTDSLFYEGKVESFLFNTSGTWYTVTDDFINSFKS